MLFRQIITIILILFVARIMDAIPVTISLKNNSGEIIPTLISLHTPSHDESTRICIFFDAESCEHLIIQTHRSLKSYIGRTYLESVGLDKTGMQATKSLASSYGIESCPKHQKLNICMFGNISKDLLLMAITSCHHYNLRVFFLSVSIDMMQFMYALRANFPGISIQWMSGILPIYQPVSLIIPC